MKTFCIITCLSLAAVSSWAQSNAPVALPPAGYKLVWSDEFNDGQLDTNKWDFRTDSKMWSTQLPQNVSVRGGKLILAVKKEDAGDKHYTGAGVISKQTFKYGYYEARFKTPPGAGWHTSFWMQKHDGAGGTDPQAATQELDVCENDSLHPDYYSVNVHKWNPQPHIEMGTKTVLTPSLSGDFHVFGCEFTPEKVRYYFDGKLVQTVAVTNFAHGDQNIWLTTIASNLGGTESVDDKNLPAAAEYDYVRFYGQDVCTNDNELDLGARVLPVPLANRVADTNYFIWDGAPIKAPDGRFHLFYARWPVNSPDGFKPGWAIHSEIAYAVADKPFGPYRFVNVALPARGTNPATGKKYWDADATLNPNIVVRDGKFLLFYNGNYGDGKYWTHRNHQRVGLAIADKLEGPWRRLDAPVIDVSPDKAAFDSLCVPNPAAVVRPDGSILVVYKGVQYIEGSEKGGNVRWGVAIAEKPEGPYLKQPGHVFEDNSADVGKHWMVAEDPYVWFSKKYGNRYYAITRDVIGIFSGETGGLALFESADGLNWKPAAHPKVLGSQFKWADGTMSDSKIERPVLLFEGDEPIALFGGTDGYQVKGRISFNVQIPLKP